MCIRDLRSLLPQTLSVSGHGEVVSVVGGMQMSIDSVSLLVSVLHQMPSHIRMHVCIYL